MKFWVQEGKDVIHFSGRKKQQFKKFKSFKSLKEVSNNLKGKKGVHYVYTGELKPNDIFGSYSFIKNKLTRIDSEYFNKD